MTERIINSIETKYNPGHKCRWTSYGNYRLMIWAWMMNEMAVMFAPTEISHNGFYIHAALYTISAIFIGIPLVYSEICLAQYTNNEHISMWNYFPLLRPVGYGAIYLVLLKAVYIMTLTSWYLQYTFYAALDPPPWYTCEDFSVSKCMVKRLNVSIFQHCLEAQLLFDEDCGVKTASNLFFEREIGDNNTKNSLYCSLSWKTIIASVSISLLLFILSLRKEKFIQISAKLLATYVCVVILLLLCVALSTSGAWYATKITIDWTKYNFDNCYKSVTRGFLCVGTGYGIIGFLSRDVPFRSPATMTSITTTSFSVLISIMYALITFSGIKTMSYYHGEEENVIEMGSSSFFLEFASTSEIMSYFDETPIWGFLWFSSIFFVLFIHLWIINFFLRDLLMRYFHFARKNYSVCNTLVAVITCFLSWPLFCSDISGAFTDAVEIIQLASSFLFSFSLYWIYGYKNHNVDIIFMIGIKASYFWKIAWILNPILILSILITKCITLDTQEIEISMYVSSLSTYSDTLTVYAIVAIYIVIVFFGIIVEIILYLHHGMIRAICSPTPDWGPRDIVLFKSRNMFVPEIMTREFLYRQVRINGYVNKEKVCVEEKTKNKSVDSESIGTEWSFLTSN